MVRQLGFKVQSSWVETVRIEVGGKGHDFIKRASLHVVTVPNDMGVGYTHANATMHAVLEWMMMVRLRPEEDRQWARARAYIQGGAYSRMQMLVPPDTKERFERLQEELTGDRTGVAYSHERVTLALIQRTAILLEKEIPYWNHSASDTAKINALIPLTAQAVVLYLAGSHASRGIKGSQ
jgi:hypothetical protein